MKSLFKDNENKISVILFAIVILVATLPLFSKYCINGHDLEYHLLRIESLKEGILIGKPFLKVNTLFFGGAGYASSMFYSDLFMHIPALLRVMGLSIGKSYHIFVALIFMLCYGSTFFCTYKITKNKYIGSLAAIVLTLAPYHLDDMLVRAACGEYMAFVFAPFVVYGLYNILFEDMSHPYAFAIGFGGLILTHPATLVMNVIMAVCVFVIFIRTFIRKPSLILKVILTTIVTMAATAFYWIPLIEQMMVSHFYVSDNYVDMLDASLNVMDVFSDAFPGAGALIIVLLLPRIFVSREKYAVLKFTDTLMVLGVMFGFASSNLLPWDRLGKYLSFIQFPWRLLTVTTTLLSISGAIVLMLFVKEVGENWVQAVVIAVMAISVFMAINHNNENITGYYDYGNDYYSYAPYTANVIGGEWLPVTVTDRDVLVELSNHMITSDGRELDFTRERAVIYSNIPEGVEGVNVPFIYYKGYVAKLIQADGSAIDLPVTGNGINGICYVETANKAGQLKVWYKSTTLTIISEIVSLITFLALIALYIVSKRGFKFTKLVSKTASFLLIGFVGLLSMSLTACSSTEIKYEDNINHIIEESSINDFSDVENILASLMVDNSEEEEEIIEEEPVYVTYNTCSRGYELDEKYFALKVDTESGKAVYSLVSVEEAEREGAEVIRNSQIYPDLAESCLQNVSAIYTDMSSTMSNVITDEDIFARALMDEADMLYFLEYFADDSRVESIRKTAEMLAGIICNSVDIASDDLKLLYNTAAVMAKAEYVLYDLDNSEEFHNIAIDKFTSAEEINSDDEESEINRVWASAEIYRITSIKTYRTIVEAYEGLMEASGFSYDNPGYYAIFAYLTVEDSTDYSISSGLMNNIFAKMNSDIKKSDEDILEECLQSGYLTGEVIDEKYINRLIEELKLSVFVNRISMSVEYVRYAKDRIIFLTGANPVGVDYFDSEHIMRYESALSALFGVRSY